MLNVDKERKNTKINTQKLKNIYIFQIKEDEYNMLNTSLWQIDGLLSRPYGLIFVLWNQQTPFNTL